MNLVFMRPLEYYNITQQKKKQNGSDMLAKFTRAGDATEIDKQPLSDHLVQMFILALNDPKLKETILKIKKVDGKIKLDDMKA